jgi:hypothetical protein
VRERNRVVGTVRTDTLKAERSKLVALIVGVVGIVFFLAGCGSQVGEGPTDPGTQERTATTAEPSISKPPESTLSFGGRPVTGEIGSYCWSSPGAPATCADAAGIPIARKQQMLTVPTGSTLTFHYGGERKPDSVEARAYPLEQEKQLLPGPEGTRLMRPRGGPSVLATVDLRVRREEADRTAIPAELSPGEYIVEVLVRVPEGDASYYFRTVVERRAGKLPMSKSPGKHDSGSSELAQKSVCRNPDARRH